MNKMKEMKETSTCFHVCRCLVTFSLKQGVLMRFYVHVLHAEICIYMYCMY